MELTNTADLLFCHQYAEINQLFKLIKILDPDHQYTKFLQNYIRDIIINTTSFDVDITLINGNITNINKECISGVGLDWIISQIRNHIKNSHIININLTCDFYLYQGLYYPQGVCQISGVHIIDKDYVHTEHKFKIMGCINMGHCISPWLMINNNKYTIIHNIDNQTLDNILNNIRKSDLYNLYKYVELNIHKNKLLIYPDRIVMNDKTYSTNLKINDIVKPIRRHGR